MLTTRWAPFTGTGMRRFHDEMNRLFERMNEANWSAGTGAFPAVNVWEDEHNVFVEAELPGLKLEDLELTVAEGNQLIIQGERKPCEVNKGVWHRQERGFGRFQRAFTLPSLIDFDKVEARFNQGILLITLPKSEAAKPRKIEVKGE